MSTHKQRMHVLLTSHDDERRLLHCWRLKNDFYSTIPGDRSHRSYHSDGRVHTKIEDWGKYYHYRDIEFKDAPGRTEGILIIHGLIARIEAIHHQTESKFKRLEKPTKKGELVFRINADTVKPNSLFAVAVCVSANRKQIDDYVKSIEKTGYLKILAIEVAPEFEGSVLFSIAFTENSEGKFSVGFMHAFGWSSGPLIPLAGTYSAVHGNSQILTIPITPEMNMGEPSPPIHEDPPYLPYKLGSWMKKYSCKIEVSRFKHIWVEIGQLFICALYKKGLWGQQLIVVIPTVEVMTEDLIIVNNSNCLSTLRSKGYMILEFQFGPMGGYTVAQFNFGDLKFQMEIKGVRGMNGYENAIDQNEFKWSDEYDIEVIEITDATV